MKRNIMHALILMALMCCMIAVNAETIDVRLRISQKKTAGQTITRENLIKIQQFILQQGKKETYCNKYNNNPAYQTKNYSFYLNPDGGRNLNCDPKKSEFHNLSIRKSDGGKNQYRTLDFLAKTMSTLRRAGLRMSSRFSRSASLR